MGPLDHNDEQRDQGRNVDDPSFAEERQRDEKLIDGLEYFGKEVFKQRLKAIHQELITPARARRRKVIRMLPMVASAAAVLLLLSFWFFRPATPALDNAPLYLAYYQPYSLEINSRAAADELLIQAAQRYQDKAYAAALPLLEAALATQPSNIQLLLACGSCCFELGSHRQALRWFERALQSDDLLYKDQARWYAALTHLRLGNQPAARALLEQLAQNKQADYHQQALLVLHEL